MGGKPDLGPLKGEEAGCPLAFRCEGAVAVAGRDKELEDTAGLADWALALPPESLGAISLGEGYWERLLRTAPCEQVGGQGRLKSNTLLKMLINQGTGSTWMASRARWQESG